MSKFPNASVLSIIASEVTEGVNKILFISVKPVPDYFDANKPFWYQNSGKRGIAKYVWPGEKIKHWFACGKDDDVYKLYDHLLMTGICEMGGKTMQFKLPTYSVRIYKPDPFYDLDQNDTEQLVFSDYSNFPQAFLQRENLAILSGYQSPTNHIKPLFPIGLYAKNELSNHLKNNVFGIKDVRKPYLTFHGIKNPKNSKELGGSIGFYQADFIPGKDYTAVWTDSSGRENARASIDQTNGIFEAAFEDQSGKGSVAILVDDLAVKKIDYVLIKEIKFDVDMASGSVKDVYGRDYMKSGKNKVRKETFSTFTWQKDVYADPKDANIKLSDKFKELLEYLGPDILILDPYFINNIKQNEVTKQFELTDCQTSFLNAFAYSAVMDGISELTIMGWNSRANQHFDKDNTQTETTTEQRFVRYESLIKGFISQNKLEDHLKPSSFHFKNAPKDFHNRYWFSFSADKKKLEKCVIITNSIGNMSEVDFIPVIEKQQLKQITLKYIDHYNLSKNELSI